MAEDNVKAQMRKGILEYCILAILLLAVHNINALVSADCASSFYCAVEESAALNVRDRKSVV